MLGEIPKIKTRENISEEDAFVTENALIKAIGRFPEGLLVNLTDTRGPSSLRIKQWHASRTPEERSATIRKGIASMTPEQLSQRGRNNALGQGRESLVERGRAWQAKYTPEYRSHIGKIGGQASITSTTYEQQLAWGLKGIKIYMETTTPEQRKENAKKTGVAKLTTKELSINGTKGVTTANNNRTLEERQALGRKAGLASASARRKRLTDNHISLLDDL